MDAPDLQHALVDSPLGALRLVVDAGGALAGLHLPGHRPAPSPESLGRRVGVGGLVAPVAEAVRAYLEGRSRELVVALADVGGTPFQRAVWEQVCAIPPGSTRTYAEVAEAVGLPGARRAVGAAIARDPRCLAVPCHRVVGERGALTGYSGGVGAKRWLLDLEARLSAAQEPAP